MDYLFRFLADFVPANAMLYAIPLGMGLLFAISCYLYRSAQRKQREDSQSVNAGRIKSLKALKIVSGVLFAVTVGVVLAYTVLVYGIMISM